MNTVLVSENIHRCRLCLKLSTEIRNIFEGDFPNMIETLTNIKLESTDDFPKTCCLSCSKNVEASIATREQIISSHGILLEEYSIGKSLDIVSTLKDISTSINSNLNETSKEKLHPEPEIILVKVEEDTPDLILQQDLDNISSFLPSQASDNIKAEPLLETCTFGLNLNNSEVSLIKINKKVNKYQKVKVKSECRKKEVKKVRLTEAELLNRRGPKPKYRNYRTEQLTPVPCKICQKSILRTNMTRHLETHDPKMVTCQICGKLCKSTTLRLHIFYFHKCKENEYICDQCGRHFRYRSKFRLHMLKEHGGTKNFECSFCGRKFFENKTMTEHIKQRHKKIKEYICHYCGKGFGRGSGLKVHLRQHTDSAPYKCDTCAQCFKQKVSLRTHMKSAHGIVEEVKVCCEVCGKGFASPQALLIHSRLHVNKKCQFCKEVFAEEEYLSRHLLEKHGTQDDSQVGETFCNDEDPNYLSDKAS